jgi:multiple sugar transport system ATP-binding protein
MATRIGVLDGGRLVQVGTPREVYERPANTHVAARLGVPGINLLPADAVPANRLLPGTHTVGARSEHVRLRPAAGGSAVGSVTRIEHLGGQIHVRARIGENAIVSVTEPTAALKLGTPIEVEFVDPLCFDAAGNRIAAEAAR